MKCRSSVRLASALTTMILTCSLHAQQSGIWLGTTGNWADTATWSGGTIADGAGFTANFTGVDIAADQTITLTTAQTIGNITFTDATTSSHNLLINGANTLTLASTTPTVNVTQSGRTLSIANVIAGTSGLTKTGPGILSLNGSAVNTLTGTLNSNGGTLTLDFTNLATPTNLIDPTNALSLGGGALTITGQNLTLATTSQTFASTTLGVGSNRINISKGALATSATLNLGALTVSPGSATTIITGTAGSTTWANGTIPTAEIIKVSSITGKTLPVASGTANWINVNAGLFYRQSTSANSARWVNVNNLGNLLPIPAGIADQETSGTVTVGRSIGGASITLVGSASSYGLLANSTSPNNRTLDLGGFTYTINGILGIGSGKTIISPGTGGTVVIGSERNLVINMDNTGGVDINAPIVDNGAGASGITIVSTIPSGTPGTVLFGGANTYTGATLINNGTLSLTGSITGGGAISTSGTGILTQSAAGVISGASTFTQGSSGTSTLAGANTHSGVTTISAGTLAISNATALGTTAGNTTIAANGSTTTGGRLLLSGSITSAENITITGGGETGAGFFSAAINNSSGTNTLSGAITLSNPTSGIRLGSAGGTLTFSGNITQTGTTPRSLVLQASTATSEIIIDNAIANNGGGLSVFGGGAVGGTITLKGVSGAGIGSTLINQSITLKLGVTDALNTSGNLVIANSGTSTDTFDLASFNQTVNGLSSQTGGNRRVTNSVASTASTLTVGNGGGSATFNGIIQDGAGTVALSKTGAGIQTLTGSNTYTGATAVNGGTLELGAAGSISNSTSLTIAAGATLDTDAQATYTIAAAQPITFGIDPTASGSSGKITAAGLDITNAVVTYNFTGTPDDPVYVLATYTSLTGAAFASVPTPPAGYTLVYNHEGNKIALVGSAAPNNYASWANDPLKGNIPGEPASGDFDLDGITNIVEYALGMNPRASSQPAGVLSGNVTITYTKGADAIANGDVTWAIETSQTLDAASWTTQVTQPAGNPSPTIAYTFTPGTPVKNFARLKVTQVP